MSNRVKLFSQLHTANVNVNSKIKRELASLKFDRYFVMSNVEGLREEPRQDACVSFFKAAV